MKRRDILNSSKYFFLKSIFLLFLVVLFPLGTQAESQFDLGLGFFGLKVNHYRGSDQTQDFNLYVPYFYYKSENIEAEGSFINTTFYDSRYFSVKLSMVVGPNVESDSNKARRDMPELNYNFGIGPMGIIHIIKGPRFFLEIDSSIRQEFQTNISHTATIGNTNTTYLTSRYQIKDFTAEFALGRMLATSDYHAYYYDVEDKYVTAERGAYKSDGGHSGNIILFSLKKKINNLMLHGFVRYDDLDGVVFEDSPLVKQTDYYMLGLGVFYLMF